MNNLNPQTEKLVGVEVSNSMLTAVCLDKTGALTDSVKTSLSSERDISAQLTDFINELKAKFGDFKKIGIALPGLLNRTTNRITLSKHIPENTDIDLAEEIRQKTGLETILENDANAAAYGEYVLGAGRGSSDVFYVTLGTGVGGAFILNGRLWRGASGFAGELGYLTINSDGMTLEEVASAGSIVRRVKTRVQQDHTSSLARIREEDIKVSDVVEAANSGDDFSRMMLERTGSYVGTAVANVINLLNIGKIVVGGEIMGAPQIVLEAIRKSASELSFKPSFETTQIAAGELGENAKAIGAALLAEEAGQEAKN
jgi:glucokinase